MEVAPLIAATGALTLDTPPFEQVNVVREGSYSVINNADKTKIYTTNFPSSSEPIHIYYENGWQSSYTGYGNTINIDSASTDTKIVFHADDYYFQNWTNIIVLKGNTVATSNDFVGLTPQNNLARYVCFAEDTEITMANGTTKKVQDIDYDDEVLCYDFDKGELSAGKVFWVAEESVADHYWKITLSDNTVINLIGKDGKSHRLFDYDNQIFNYPQDINGRTYKQDGEKPYIISCEQISENIKYYNFTNDNINCFANNILCGNRFSNIYEIKDMKYIKTKKENTFDNFEGIPQEYIDGLRLREQDVELDGVKYGEDLNSHIINCYVNKAKAKIN